MMAYKKVCLYYGEICVGEKHERCVCVEELCVMCEIWITHAGTGPVVLNLLLLITSHKDHFDGVKRGKILSIVCLPIEALALTLPPTRPTKSHADTCFFVYSKIKKKNNFCTSSVPTLNVNLNYSFSEVSACNARDA